MNVQSRQGRIDWRTPRTILDTLGGTVLLAGFHRSNMIIKAENASLPPYSGCGSSLE
jgi:hypothetical protein